MTPTRSIVPSPERPRLIVALEHHFVRVRGEVYTQLAFGYPYWAEYHARFQTVGILARVHESDAIPAGAFRADGPGVNVIPMPVYRGPRAFLQALPRSLRAAWAASGQHACFLLRSGNIATLLWLCLLLRRRPYAREVQGDVYGAVLEFQGAARAGLAGRLIATTMDRLCAWQVRGASATSYVSPHLQRHYPSRRPSREFVFSSVSLSPDLVGHPRPASAFSADGLRLVSIGRLEREKGHQVLLEALQLLTRDVPAAPIHLRLIGDGSQLHALRACAQAAGLADRVEFTGLLPHGPQLFAHLDWADLFILPSLSEGMPRALIEAMARGLPALGSATGGILELLDPDQCVPAGDAHALARALRDRLGHPDRLADESRRNHARALARFDVARMQQIKLDFWGSIVENCPHD